MEYFWNQVVNHWAATPYDWGGKEPDGTYAYHTLINADHSGKNPVLHHFVPYTTPLHRSVFGRNENTISLSMACMSDIRGTWGMPPTEQMIDMLCEENAKIALMRNWDADQLFPHITTHAEVAGLRDFPRGLVEKFSLPAFGRRPSSDFDSAAQANNPRLPHANYGPATWHDGWPGGDVVRWDLWKLREGDVGGEGGHEIRKRTSEWMRKLPILSAKK